MFSTPIFKPEDRRLPGAEGTAFAEVSTPPLSSPVSEENYFEIPEHLFGKGALLHIGTFGKIEC